MMCKRGLTMDDKTRERNGKKMNGEISAIRNTGQVWVGTIAKANGRKKDGQRGHYYFSRGQKLRHVAWKST